MEEVRLKWAPGQVAVEKKGGRETGREKVPTDALPRDRGKTCKQENQGTAISSAAALTLTRTKNSSYETGPSTWHLKKKISLIKSS